MVTSADTNSFYRDQVRFWPIYETPTHPNNKVLKNDLAVIIVLNEAFKHAKLKEINDLVKVQSRLKEY